ncbi:MAG: hypothetical protein R2882_15590 [Gemmatimonadales bacterium]
MSNYASWPGGKWTSADAAGLPILPGLSATMVAAGVITHAIRFTVSKSRKYPSVPGAPLAQQQAST